MDKLYIIIPAYNEEENILNVINDWYPIVEKLGNDSRLVIIDDGSKDNTYSLMLKEATNRPYFQPLTKQNGGHGATVLYGYHHAISCGADYIFQTDSDGQTIPSEFYDFWPLRESYNMIIGHRKGREDGIVRILVTKILKIVLSLCFHVNIKDANTPFRLMDAKTLKENIKLIPKDYNLSNVIVSVIYAKKKLKVKYLPITFRPRQGGVNSINLKKIIKIGKVAYKDFIQLNRYISE